MKVTELCFPLARLVSEWLKVSMLWNMQLFGEMEFLSHLAPNTLEKW